MSSNVSWERYGLEEHLWELIENFENVPDIVKEFHRLHPNIAGLNHQGT